MTVKDFVNQITSENLKDDEGNFVSEKGLETVYLIRLIERTLGQLLKDNGFADILDTYNKGSGSVIKMFNRNNTKEVYIKIIKYTVRRETISWYGTTTYYNLKGFEINCPDDYTMEQLCDK